MIVDAESRLRIVYDRATKATGRDVQDLERALLSELASAHTLSRSDLEWFRHLLSEGAHLEAAIEITRLFRGDIVGSTTFGPTDRPHICVLDGITEMGASPALAVIAAHARVAGRRLSAR